jgi:uncharacterized protein YjaZ
MRKTARFILGGFVLTLLAHLGWSNETLTAGFYENPNDADGIEWIDLSGKQLRLMNQYRDHPEKERNHIMLDSIYYPYTGLWEGYIGPPASFLSWKNNTAFDELEQYQAKAARIDTDSLHRYLLTANEKMRMLTGYGTHGKWFVFFGPKWTNLGGLSGGTMVIDLANIANRSKQDITRAIPHEISHQIYAHTCPDPSPTVLESVINEGLACYVSYLFHEGLTSIANELSYREEEYATCRERDSEVLGLLQPHVGSADGEVRTRFRHRGYRFAEGLPGAIGYYIGFRIVEEYVNRHGEDAWKQIYTLHPHEVLERSGVAESWK